MWGRWGEHLSGGIENHDGWDYPASRMKTATIGDLRKNFSRVSRWLAAGEKVALTNRGAAVGTIVPPPKSANGKPHGKLAEKSLKERQAIFRYRFGAYHDEWMKKVYGGKVLPGNSVLEMRKEDRW
jgi:antitoxin (DNA-binding transcriptional repressor) of toxin-antitoxin stability system